MSRVLLNRAFFERSSLGYITDATRVALARIGLTAVAIESYLSFTGAGVN